MSDRESNDKHEDMLSELFENASPRPQPSNDARERAFTALHGEWHALAAQRQSRQRIARWSIAAAFVIAAILGFRAVDRNEPVPLLPVASIERISGDRIFINDRLLDSAAKASSTINLVAGDTLRAGPESLVALGWSGGGSLRIAAGTTIRIQSAEAIRLREGRIYFDSQPFGHAAKPQLQFSVETAFGRIRHVGTQFMLQQDAARLSVSVREGQVQLQGPTIDVAVRSGDEKILLANGNFEQRPIDADDARWNWVSDIAPQVQLSGLTLDKILRWVGRETGRTVVYRNNAARHTALNEQGVGLDGLTPQQVLETIPAISTLRASARNGRIIVE